eukprot:CAMPEP_0183739756 /NCGR_PEP_ID=MMETSP0737-20130205/57906_1 /TAXON_ID=385413 /ORGANISM="Thalassiosira miniscula, Strain CCMP1093" /LENGTH=56 /DNA_ID=CAMNT_0025974635 /DNA_START=446 /DNA_END=616 /DNA_ORIENTATION=-
MTKQTNGRTLLATSPGARPTVSIGLYISNNSRAVHSNTNIKYMKGMNDRYLWATMT